MKKIGVHVLPVSSYADVGVVEVLLSSPYLPGGVTQGPQQKKSLYVLPFSRENAFGCVWREGGWFSLAG